MDSTQGQGPFLVDAWLIREAFVQPRSRAQARHFVES